MVDNPTQPPFLDDFSGVREYIGARYVPVFANPPEWDDSRGYEPLTIVLYQGNSYTSTQTVPPGIDINNTEFWAKTGNYNAQIEAYRKEVHDLSVAVSHWQTQLDTVNSTIDTINSTVDTINGDVSNLQTNVTALENIKMQKGKKAVFLGDSITYGQRSSTGGQVDKPWPSVMGDYLGFEVTNIAVGGATAANYSNAPSTAKAQVDSINTEYDYAFFMFGTNDYGYDGAIHPHNMYENLQQDILDLLTKYPNTKVIGVIPPYMPGDTVKNSRGFTALDYKTFVRAAYCKQGVPIIDFTHGLSWNQSNWDTILMPWDIALTRLHPSQAGYDEMGYYAANVFNTNGQGTWADYPKNMAGYAPELASGASWNDRGEPALINRDEKTGVLYVDLGQGVKPATNGYCFTVDSFDRPYRTLYIAANYLLENGTVESGLGALTTDGIFTTVGVRPDNASLIGTFTLPIQYFTQY